MIPSKLTPEQFSQLVQLRRDGHSFSQIGAAMAMTRSQVAGYCSRNAIPFNAAAYDAARPRLPTATRERQRNVKHRAMLFAPIERKKMKRAPSSFFCLLEELQPQSCRWPINDPPKHGRFLFCGHPSADFPLQSYCDFHARMSRSTG